MSDTFAPTPDLDAMPDDQAVALLNRVLADPDVQGVDEHAAEQTPAPQIGDLA